MWICSLHGVAQLIAGRLTASPASHEEEEHGENQNKSNFVALLETACELGVCPCSPFLLPSAFCCDLMIGTRAPQCPGAAPQAKPSGSLDLNLFCAAVALV